MFLDALVNAPGLVPVVRHEFVLDAEDVPDDAPEMEKRVAFLAGKFATPLFQTRENHVAKREQGVREILLIHRQPEGGRVPRISALREDGREVGARTAGRGGGRTGSGVPIRSRARGFRGAGKLQQVPHRGVEEAHLLGREVTRAPEKPFRRRLRLALRARLRQRGWRKRHRRRGALTVETVPVGNPRTRGIELIQVGEQFAVRRLARSAGRGHIGENFETTLSQNRFEHQPRLVNPLRNVIRIAQLIRAIQRRNAARHQVTRGQTPEKEHDQHAKRIVRPQTARKLELRRVHPRRQFERIEVIDKLRRHRVQLPVEFGVVGEDQLGRLLHLVREAENVIETRAPKRDAARTGLFVQPLHQAVHQRITAQAQGVQLFVTPSSNGHILGKGSANYAQVGAGV